MFNHSPYDLLQKMDQEIIREESEEPIRCITANKLLCKFGEVSNYTGHVKDWDLHRKVVLKVGRKIDKKIKQKAMKAVSNIYGINLCFLLRFSTY